MRFGRLRERSDALLDTELGARGLLYSWFAYNRSDDGDVINSSIRVITPSGERRTIDARSGARSDSSLAVLRFAPVFRGAAITYARSALFGDHTIGRSVARYLVTYDPVTGARTSVQAPQSLSDLAADADTLYYSLAGANLPQEACNTAVGGCGIWRADNPTATSSLVGA